MDIAYAADLAYAAAQPPGGQGSGAMVTQLVFFGAIFAIFYFLLIRPQQRQKRERENMLRAVKRGDRVVTTGGIFGTVTGLSDQTITLRIADQVKVEFERGAIGRIVEAQGDKDA